MDSVLKKSVRFGPFEVDCSTQELRKHGVRIKLQKQPFQILAALLQRPNDVVSRQELRQQVWTGETFVDFEHGVNAAMNKLRQALGDSADSPRYIETVPGVGYRWMAPVDAINASIPVPTSAKVAPQSSGTWPRWVLAAMILGGALGGWFLRFAAERDPVSRLMEFTVPPPEGLFFEPALTRQDFAVSPDGERLALIASDTTKSQLWVGKIGSLKRYPIAVSGNVRGVVWSPDSRFLYFDEHTTVRRVSRDGDAVQTICELPPGPPWMGLLQSGDRLVMYTRGGSYEVPAPGGTARRLDDVASRWPQALPDGRILRVDYDRQIQRYRAVATSPKNHTNRQMLAETESRAVYTPPSAGERKAHLLYVRGGSLIAHPLDVQNLRTTGEPLAIATNVFSFAPTGAAAFSVSSNGVLAYRNVWPPLQMKWYDRTGQEVGKVGEPATFFGQFRLSPDRTKLAVPIYDVEKGGIDLWIHDFHTSSRRKLTNVPGVSNPGIWSPDGDRIVFARAQGETPKLYWTSTGQPAKEEALTPSYFQIPTDWSLDGRYIAYQTGGGAGEPESNVFLMDLTNQRRLVPLLRSGFRAMGASFSPDGTRLTFLSDETGRAEVYAQIFDSGQEPRLKGERLQLSQDGASVIRWRPDGKELLYLNGEGWLISIPVSKNGRFGKPQRLFQAKNPARNLNGAGPDLGFDVSQDGRRLLMIDGRDFRPPPLVIMQNWQQSLRR